jgi:hypothetical protein
MSEILTDGSGDVVGVEPSPVQVDSIAVTSDSPAVAAWVAPVKVLPGDPAPGPKDNIVVEGVEYAPVEDVPAAGVVVIEHPATCEDCGAVDERYAIINGKCQPCNVVDEKAQKAQASNLSKAMLEFVKRNG